MRTLCSRLPVLLIIAYVVVVSGAPLHAQVLPNFYARQDYAGLYTASVTPGDVNGDGFPDIVASNLASYDILFGNGDGTFRIGPQDEPSGITGAQTLVLDVNGDGKVDLLTSGTNGNMSAGFVVHLGNGDGTIQPGTFYVAGTETLYTEVSTIIAADFTNDGVLDVVQLGVSGVWLFTGRGDGTFNPAVLAVPLTGAFIWPTAADFNEDGNQDLVVTLPGAGVQGGGFVVLFGNGNGTFQPPVTFSQPLAPGTALAGKLGVNGHAGIVLSFSSQNLQPELAVYIGDGHGGFSGPQYLSSPGGSLAIGDIDGDGIPDIA